MIDEPDGDPADAAEADPMSLVDEALVAGNIANTNGLLVILAKLVAKGIFDAEDLQMFLRLNFPDPAEARDWRVSPIWAESLEGLPPAHIMSAEYDALRDDGLEYARRLKEAGVPATFSLQKGHVHVSGMMTAAMESARAWRQELLTVLQRAHEQDAS